MCLFFLLELDLTREATQRAWIWLQSQPWQEVEVTVDEAIQMCIQVIMPRCGERFPCESLSCERSHLKEACPVMAPCQRLATFRCGSLQRTGYSAVAGAASHHWLLTGRIAWGPRQMICHHTPAQGISTGRHAWTIVFSASGPPNNLVQ